MNILEKMSIPNSHTNYCDKTMQQNQALYSRNFLGKSCKDILSKKK